MDEEIFLRGCYEYINNQKKLINIDTNGKYDDTYLDELYEFALEKLKIDTINMQDKVFVDFYEEENVQKDLNLEETIKERFNKDEMAVRNKKLATILEAFLYIQIEQNMILGDVSTTSTSPFDDFVNHIDTVMEINNPDSEQNDYLAVAYDAAMSSNEDNPNLNKKLNSIEENISDGTMFYVKYFKSRNDKNIIGLKGIPKLIIGMNLNILDRVVSLWKDGSNKELNNHPFRLIILDQIIEQIKYFIGYAQKHAPKERKKYILNGHEELLYCKEDIINKYQNLLSFFENFNNQEKMQSLRQEILNDPEKQRMYDNDNVLQFFKNLSIRK